jgi:hypothetical protein
MFCEFVKQVNRCLASASFIYLSPCLGFHPPNPSILTAPSHSTKYNPEHKQVAKLEEQLNTLEERRKKAAEASTIVHALKREVRVWDVWGVWLVWVMPLRLVYPY